MRLIEPEYWDKPYKCKKCGIRFETITVQQHHVQEHRRGMCPICKKLGLLEDHHYSYKDFEEDKKKNTIRICNICHGYQTIIKKEIRSGIPQTYIGHILKH